MNAQEALNLAMQENGVKTVSVKVQRYLQGVSKCSMAHWSIGVDSKGYDIWGRQVVVLATGEKKVFSTVKDACLFMAGKWAERRA